MKALSLAYAPLLLSAPIASAGPAAFDLSWSDCGTFGTLDRSFACNSNSGQFTLVGSFVTTAPVLAASGITCTLHLQSSSASFPSWWGMAPGLCRTGSLASSFDFMSGPFDCFDYWQGGASGGAVMDSPTLNRTTITVTAALPAGSPLVTSIPDGVEVYAFKLVIDAAKTTGPGSCTGCQDGVLICLTSMTITQVPGTPGGDLYVGQPAHQGFVTWRGGLGNVYCEAVATRNTTWGAIKTFYR